MMESENDTEIVRSIGMEHTGPQNSYLEDRQGNVYIDEDGRKIYRTSGKSGNSKRYVVMDDGELTRGEHQEISKIIHKDETDYETDSESDSEYLVPGLPKCERRNSRHFVEDKPRIVTGRTVSEEKPHAVSEVSRGIVEEQIPISLDSNGSGTIIFRIVRIRPRYRELNVYKQESVDYTIHRPPTRDVGCQMTTTCIIQLPPMQRKLSRNVETQTVKDKKESKPNPIIPTPPHPIPKPPPWKLPHPRPPNPTKEKSKKGKRQFYMVRVGGGWMKVEHHRNHHTPLKIYEIPRDANDDKFLYIKSRFSSSKKDVPIAYKKYRDEIVRGRK